MSENQSRIENILETKIDQTVYEDRPLSRIEDLLLQLNLIYIGTEEPQGEKRPIMWIDISEQEE